ncbi:MAG: tetratricopeptide repeat protein [Candidatus Aminicenantales bacterium]
MKKAFLVLFFLLLFCFMGLAQDYKGKGRVVGYVYDKEGKPIENVTVKFFSPKVGQGFDIATDKNGKWVAFGIIGGGWNVDFEKVGYLPKKIAIQVDEWKRNPDINVTLEKAEGLILTDELKDELNKGNQLFEEKKYGEAIAVFQAMIEKYPDAYILNKNIGNCYFAQEQYDLAEQYYQKILDREPANVEAILLIGNCYANRGQNEKALEWYGKIEFEKIDDPIVLYNVGTNYYNSSKFEEALKYYRKATEIQKDFLDALYQLGLTYLTLGNYQESINTFENYIKLDANSERANQVKGFLEFLKKKD